MNLIMFGLNRNLKTKVRHKTLLTA